MVADGASGATANEIEAISVKKEERVIGSMRKRAGSEVGRTDFRRTQNTDQTYSRHEPSH